MWGRLMSTLSFIGIKIMNELELILSLARDVENLLKKAGVLGSLEKHPVVQEIENALNAATENIPPSDVNSVPVTNA